MCAMLPPGLFRRRPQQSVFLLLRGEHLGLRHGVELGCGPRNAVRVCSICDLLGRSRPGGEAAQAEGHVAGESMVDSPRDAGGELEERIKTIRERSKSKRALVCLAHRGRQWGVC